MVAVRHMQSRRPLGCRPQSSHLGRVAADRVTRRARSTGYTCTHHQPLRSRRHTGRSSHTTDTLRGNGADQQLPRLSHSPTRHTLDITRASESRSSSAAPWVLHSREAVPGPPSEQCPRIPPRSFTPYSWRPLRGGECARRSCIRASAEALGGVPAPSMPWLLSPEGRC